MKKFFQCSLSQNGQRTVGWIEERGARIGALVEVPELGGYWHVDRVGDHAMDKRELSEMTATKRKGFKSIDRS